MAVQRTFSIIKPDATKRNLTGAITAKLEEAGLRVVASKRIRLTLDNAAGAFKPDMYAEVSLQAELGNVLSVPEEAIIVAGASRLVFEYKLVVVSKDDPSI